MPMPGGPLDICMMASRSVHSFSKYRVDNFGNRRTDGQMNGLVENIKSFNENFSYCVSRCDKRV